MNELVQSGEQGLNIINTIISSPPSNSICHFNDLELLAPIPNPIRNIFCVGRNYHEHAQEFHDSGFDATAGTDAIPEHPIIFTKATTCVSGPHDSIPAFLDPTNSTDYEGELAVIIGKGGKNISIEEAMKSIAGYLSLQNLWSLKMNSLRDTNFFYDTQCW